MHSFPNPDRKMNDVAITPFLKDEMRKLRNGSSSHFKSIRWR